MYSLYRRSVYSKIIFIFNTGIMQVKIAATNRGKKVLSVKVLFKSKLWSASLKISKI